MASAARAAVADRLVTPWWFHPAQGLLIAVFVVVVTFLRGDTSLGILGALVLFAVGVFVLDRVYQRLTGVRISTKRAGRARRWLYAMGGMIWAGTTVSLAVASATSLMWPTWCIAGLLWAGSVVLGRRFDTALRAQLRSTGA